MIPNLPVEEPKEIIEVWKKLTGENSKQIDEIIEKLESMINKLKSSELFRNIFWKGFIVVLWSSIQHVLPSYAITVK